MAMVSTRFQEVYSLAAWYQDILKRYDQLAAWTAGSIVTPNCVWLPGLFNPKVRPTTKVLLYVTIFFQSGWQL